MLYCDQESGNGRERGFLGRTGDLFLSGSWFSRNQCISFLLRTGHCVSLNRVISGKGEDARALQAKETNDRILAIPFSRTAIGAHAMLFVCAALSRIEGGSMTGTASSGVPKARTCFVANLGLTGVEDADRFMSAARELRVAGDVPDLLLFLSHPGTVALGLKDRLSEHPRDLLVPIQRLEAEGIALVRSVRGGGITYHWPGQVVCYPVLSLGPFERNIPSYMHKLEEVGIRTLKSFGVESTRRRDSAAHVGLWCERSKVASMGVRVSHWVTSFGFAINHEGDHGPSAYVRPCGLEGVRLTTLEELLGQAPPRSWVVDAITENFAEVLERHLEEIPEETLHNIESLSRATDLTKTG